MEAEEWGGGSRDEDTKLVDSAVCWVERAVGWERGFGKWKEECGCNAEVYGIFGHIDKEEGDHAGVQSSACLKGMAWGRINWKERLLAESREVLLTRGERGGGTAEGSAEREFARSSGI